MLIQIKIIILVIRRGMAFKQYLRVAGIRLLELSLLLPRVSIGRELSSVI